jgi:hypothetical protein
MIMEDMAAWARQDGLRNFEQVSRRGVKRESLVSMPAQSGLLES